MHGDVAGANVTFECIQQGPAVHTGKADVDDDAIRRKVARQLQAGLPCGCRHAFQTAPMACVAEHLGKGRVVLDDENDPVARFKRFTVVGDGGRSAQSGLRRSDFGMRCGNRRFRCTPFHGQIQGENRASARLAGHLDLSTQQTGQLPGDGKPQACSAVIPVSSAINLLKGLVDHLLVFGCDADASVLNCNLKRLPRVQPAARQIAVGARGAKGNGNAAGFGELDGVGNQVSDDLLNAPGVRGNGRRRCGIDMDLQRQPFLLGQVLESAADPFGHFGKRRHAIIEIDPAALNFGKIQNIVDQAEQVGPAAMDDLGASELVFGEITLPVLDKSLGQQQKTVQRAAQLVGHVGKKLRFVIAGQGQLCGIGLHSPSGLFDFVLVLLQHLVLFFQRLVGDLQFLLLPFKNFLGCLQSLGLLFQLLIGGSELLLLGLELLGLPLGLRKQKLLTFSGLGRLDGDGNALGCVIQKLPVVLVNGPKGAELHDALDLTII